MSHQMNPWTRVMLLSVAVWSGIAAAERGAALAEAIQAGDVAAIRALVRQQVDVNHQDATGITPLHWAVFRRDVETVDLLLRAGARVQTPNNYGVTSLELASLAGHAEIVKRLVDAGADVNAVGPGGQTALMNAARVGDLATLKVLLASGAAVNARQAGSGQTALMWAVMENNVSAIRLLIEMGADIHAYTQEDDPGARGSSPKSSFELPQSVATSARGASLAQLLERFRKLPKAIDDFTRGRMQQQASAQQRNQLLTALHFAVREGHMDATKALLEAGADVNAPLLPTGMSPLVVAIFNNHFELAAYLVERGADVNASEQGWSPLHQVARSRQPNYNVANPVPTGRMTSLDLAKLLLDRGANPNARMTADFTDLYRVRINWLGATPLMVAAKGVDTEIIRLLLDRGADASLKTVDEMIPLMAAAGVGVWNPGEDYGTKRPYDARALEAVKLLVAAGNDPQAVDINRENALHGAAYTGRNEVVEYLVNLGVSLDARNVLGWTPLRIADGVQYAGFAKHQRHTAAFIRKMLADRGLPVPEFENYLENIPTGNVPTTLQDRKPVLKEESAKPQGGVENNTVPPPTVK